MGYDCSVSVEQGKILHSKLAAAAGWVDRPRPASLRIAAGTA